MGIPVYWIALMCACRAALLLKRQREHHSIDHMPQFQWTRSVELQCVFNHLNYFNMVLELLANRYLNHRARVVEFGGQSRNPSTPSAPRGFFGPMRWLVVWILFLGGGEARCTKTISVSNLGLIASGERWYLKLGWHHISGNSFKVNARGGAANEETLNGFLQQHGRTGLM